MCKIHLPESICQSLSVIWRTLESLARDGEVCTGVGGSLGRRAPFPLSLAPGKAIKLRDISAAKVDKVTTESNQILSGDGVGICPRRKMKNNKKRKNTTGKRTGGEGESLVTTPSEVTDVGLLPPLS